MKVAFIPARGGSKGIPGKNLVDINGLPLIAYSINSARGVGLFDEVVVSTDSREIAEVAMQFGASVPYMRASHLATDNASTEGAIVEFVEWTESADWKVDEVILLQPTSPLRRASSIAKAVALLQEYDSCFSVCESHRFFWRSGDPPTASYNYRNRPRRQDLAKEQIQYAETGSIYGFRMKAFRHDMNRICGRFCFFEVADDEQYEIDTLTDLEVLRQLLSGLEDGE